MRMEYRFGIYSKVDMWTGGQLFSVYGPSIEYDKVRHIKPMVGLQNHLQNSKNYRD